MYTSIKLITPKCKHNGTVHDIIGGNCWKFFGLIGFFYTHSKQFLLF